MFNQQFRKDSGLWRGVVPRWSDNEHPDLGERISTHQRYRSAGHDRAQTPLRRIEAPVRSMTVRSDWRGDFTPASFRGLRSGARLQLLSEKLADGIQRLR
jgi:hypothetical protein